MRCKTSISIGTYGRLPPRKLSCCCKIPFMVSTATSRVSEQWIACRVRSWSKGKSGSRLESLFARIWRCFVRQLGLMFASRNTYHFDVPDDISNSPHSMVVKRRDSVNNHSMKRINASRVPVIREQECLCQVRLQGLRNVEAEQD